MKARASRGFTWYWTPQLWRWNPAEGPWRPTHGGPKTAAYLEVTAAGMRPKQSYDFWCESAFYNFLPDPWSLHAEDVFHARARGWCSPQGNVFTYESGPIAGQGDLRKVDESGDLEIGIVLAGTRFVQPRQGAGFIGCSGDFFAYDPGRPCRVRWTHHRAFMSRCADRQSTKSLTAKFPIHRRSRNR